MIRFWLCVVEVEDQVTKRSIPETTVFNFEYLCVTRSSYLKGGNVLKQASVISVSKSLSSIFFTQHFYRDDRTQPLSS